MGGLIILLGGPPPLGPGGPFIGGLIIGGPGLGPLQPPIGGPFGLGCLILSLKGGLLPGGPLFIGGNLIGGMGLP